MEQQNKTLKRIEIAALICIPLLFLLVYHFRVPLLWIASIFGKCQFHEVTGYHCPGCGNTRAVIALFRLKPFTAFRNNPLMPMLFFFGLEAYIELALDVCGKKVKLVPRKAWFWIGLLIALSVFYIIRNFIPVLAPIPPAT